MERRERFGTLNLAQKKKMGNFEFSLDEVVHKKGGLKRVRGAKRVGGGKTLSIKRKGIRKAGKTLGGKVGLKKRIAGRRPGGKVRQGRNGFKGRAK